MKNVTGVDTMQSSGKDDLANSKSNVDKLHIDKLEKKLFISLYLFILI